jgi:Ankyrin repeats (3 copies)
VRKMKDRSQEVPTTQRHRAVFLALCLVALGARSATDPNAALLKAADAGNTAAIESALSAGADVNTKDADGWTPMLFAASNGNVPALTLLLARGGDFNLIASDGMTTLMLAAVAKHPEVITFLMTRGVNRYRLNNAGVSAYQLALTGGDEATISAMKAQMKKLDFVSVPEDLLDPPDDKDTDWAERNQDKIDKVNPGRWTRLDIPSLLHDSGFIPVGEFNAVRDSGSPLPKVIELANAFALKQNLDPEHSTTGFLIIQMLNAKQAKYAEMKQRAAAASGVLEGSGGFYCSAGLRKLGFFCPLIWSESNDVVILAVSVPEDVWGKFTILKNMGTTQESFRNPDGSNEKVTMRKLSIKEDKTGQSSILEIGGGWMQGFGRIFKKVEVTGPPP